MDHLANNPGRADRYPKIQDNYPIIGGNNTKVSDIYPVNPDYYPEIQANQPEFRDRYPKHTVGYRNIPDGHPIGPDCYLNVWDCATAITVEPLRGSKRWDAFSKSTILQQLRSSILIFVVDLVL